MKRLVPIIVIAVIVAGAAYFAYVRTHSERGIEGPVLSARFLDAEFGNAVILRTPEGKTVVIDPASGRGGKALADLLDGERTRAVTVIFTNPTPDRAAALAALRKTVRVSKVIRPELGAATQAWKRAIVRAKCGPVAEVALAGGDKLRLSPKVVIEALGPVRPSTSSGCSARGGYDGSLVFRVRFGAKTIFFPSEIRAAGESDLIASGRDLTGSVLVVGPRAQYRGVSLELLSMVRPEVIVVSSSTRPSSSVIGRLSERNTGAALYQTYKDGIIEIDTNGRSIQVATGGGEP